MNDFDTARVVYLDSLFEGLPCQRLPEFNTTLPLSIARGDYTSLTDPAVVCRGTIALLADELRTLNRRPKRKKYLHQVIGEISDDAERTLSEGDISGFTALSNLTRYLDFNQGLVLRLSYSLPDMMKRARGALIEAGFVQYECFSSRGTFEQILQGF